MKSIRIIAIQVAALVLLMACSSKDDPNKLDSGKVTITGTIEGIQDGTIELATMATDSITIDTIELKGGKFKHVMEIKEPSPYMLRVSGGVGQPLFLYADPTTITIKGHSDSINKATVKGGKSQALFSQLNVKLQEVETMQQGLQQEYMMAQSTGDTAALSGIEKRLVEGNDNLVAYAKELAVNNPTNPVSAFLAANFLTDPSKMEDLKTTFEAFSPAVKSSYFGKQLGEYLDASAKTSVGALAPDFAQPDVQGNPFQLSSLRGKVVLLDFWASWCGPCRVENPNVVAAYNKYKDKGFDIIGVSLDQSSEDWIKAIGQDKLTWHHVGDMQGWQNAAAQLYGIRAIPASFLLDKDGKIIARDLRGEALDKKLAELLN